MPDMNQGGETVIDEYCLSGVRLEISTNCPDFEDLHGAMTSTTWTGCDACQDSQKFPGC